MPILLAAALVAAVSALPRHAVFGAALDNKTGGVTVTRVIPNSAAAASGLHDGDVIVKLNGVATPDVASFLAEMHRLHAAQYVSVSVLRDGRAIDLEPVLSAPPNESDPAATTSYGAIEVDGSLRRTLITYPAGTSAQKLPAMLIVGGIGCFSIDVASNPQDAYLHLAHDLAKNGVVTMRVEKSGVGDSQGPPCRSTGFFAEERAYVAALAALRADPRVDPARVYVFGHSIGTTVAPRLAEKGGVAGIVVAEGVGRDWLEYELRNTRRQLELTGSTPVATDAGVNEKYACMYRLLVAKEDEASIERSMPSCKDHNGVYPVDPVYVQEVATLAILEAWTKVRVPVLAIYGGSDFVTEAADHERIVAAVNANAPGAATFRQIDGMDHWLSPAATPKDSLAALSSSTPRQYDTRLSDVIVAWLKAHGA